MLNMDVASVVQYESDVSDEEVIREDHEINEKKYFKRRNQNFGS